MTSTALVLMILAMVTWLVMIADLFTVVGMAAPGDRDIFLGLRWLFAGLMLCASWGCLAGLLLIAGGQNRLPGWEIVAALLLVPLSAAAALAALYVVNETPARWPLLI